MNNGPTPRAGIEVTAVDAVGRMGYLLAGRGQRRMMIYWEGTI